MKKKKRRKIWPVILNRYTYMLVLAAAVVLLFRTRAVEVEGNSYYSENTISTWVQRDRLSVNTLYILVKYDFMDAELPAGVERLNVSLKNPWTVRVAVEEKEMAGYVDYDGAYLYFDRTGTAVLKTRKSRLRVSRISKGLYLTRQQQKSERHFRWKMTVFLKRSWMSRETLRNIA